MENLNEQDQDSSKGIRDAASGVAQRLDLRLDLPLEFPCLDGVRALAALLVLINHSSAFASGFDSGWSPEPVRIVTGLFGRIGVATFFVISGFLLYRPFVLAHLSGVDGGSAGRFWVRRFARILPGYWIA
ncbi:MAG: acyltransferase, partial [Acidimicrobiia bacterium]|nr:acyltransferase [Acidimicrobiia bacterium]